MDANVLWYSQKISLYESLAKKVNEIIKEVLDDRNIKYYEIQYRGKTIESFKQKLMGDISFDPKKMQDLAGIRIIAYVNSEVEKISDIIQSIFSIDKSRSVDKAEMLGVDKVGYRSLHFVATCPEERAQLPEYKQYEGLFFEIQIRTILQHAWAEIQHDKNYKSAEFLPNDIRRDVSLLAGQLEIADKQFDGISKFIDKYSQEVAEKTKAKDLNIPINSESLRQYLINEFGDVSSIEPIFGPDDSLMGDINKELKLMQIQTLAELDAIIPENFKETFVKNKVNSNFAGIMRDILIIHDADKYFTTAWKKKWSRGGSGFVKNLRDFGINANELAKKYDFHVSEESE